MCDFFCFLCELIDPLELLLTIFFEVRKLRRNASPELSEALDAWPPKQLGAFGHFGRPFSMY